MRVEELLPSPISGISTLADRNRLAGQAGEQCNFRSDPVNKLTRRPSVEYVTELLDSIVADDVVHHSYERDGVVYRIVVDADTENVYGFVDNVQVTVNDNLEDYISNNLKMQTVDHTTYVVNPNITVAKSDVTDGAYFKYVHINVTTALSYGETVQVNITSADGTVDTSVSYTVPELGSGLDYDTADTARATNQVATELALLIAAEGINAESKGSCVAVYGSAELMLTEDIVYDLTGDGGSPDDITFDYYDDDGVSQSATIELDWTLYDAANFDIEPVLEDLQDKVNVYPNTYMLYTIDVLTAEVTVYSSSESSWPYLEIETGQGDRSCVVFNETVQETTGIPLYAKVGTRITVQPDPTDDDDVYYLQAERVADEASGDTLEEVAWTEARAPDEQYAYDLTTMPYVIEYDEDTNEFNVSQGDWTARQVGDDDSNDWPEFVGNTIVDVSYFQNRLVFLSGNYVCMSETDDEENFFLQSAIDLLVSDRVQVSSSAVGVDAIKHAISHNRDMLLLASNAQFKIDGTSSITPSTGSMQQTTSYECDTSVAPVGLGNSVLFTIDYGDSVGVMGYTAEANTGQDTAHAITHHVIGYMPGDPVLMVSSPNLEMVALTTDESEDNQIFIYEQFTSRTGELKQQAWSDWVISGGGTILDMEFRNNKLTLIVHEGTSLYVKEMNMYTRVSTGVDEIYLDDLVELDTTGTTATLPDGYVATDDMLVIRGEDLDYQYFKATYTEDSGTITFDEDVGAGTVYVGKPYTSTYTPTRPFKRDENGQAITTDRIRVGRYILGVVDTHQIKMSITSDYYDADDQVFNSRYVGGLDNLVGEMPFHTGDVKFSYSQDADYATATFYDDGWLGCSIASISWEGQYYQSKRRF